jgi:hypothetical protein
MSRLEAVPKRFFMNNVAGSIYRVYRDSLVNITKVIPIGMYGDFEAITKFRKDNSLSDAEIIGIVYYRFKQD